MSPSFYILLAPRQINVELRASMIIIVQTSGGPIYRCIHLSAMYTAKIIKTEVRARENSLSTSACSSIILFSY